MHRRRSICGLLLVALVLPAVLGVATGLHLEWASHHHHTHSAAHDPPEPHTRLDHTHHSHEPVAPETLDALLRPAGHHSLNQVATSQSTVVSDVQVAPVPRSHGVSTDGAPPGTTPRDTLHSLCTLLL